MCLEEGGGAGEEGAGAGLAIIGQEFGVGEARASSTCRCSQPMPRLRLWPLRSRLVHLLEPIVRAIGEQVLHPGPIPLCRDVGGELYGIAVQVVRILEAANVVKEFGEVRGTTYAVEIHVRQAPADDLQIGEQPDANCGSVSSVAAASAEERKASGASNVSSITGDIFVKIDIGRHRSHATVAG